MKTSFLLQERQNEVDCGSEGIVRIMKFFLSLIGLSILIAILMLLFDSGAVMVAEQIIQVNPPQPW